MNLLIDRCPELVDIEGETYPIRSDYRTSILFELTMSNPKLSESQKVSLALRLYYERLPEDTKGIARAFSSAVKFYNLGKSIERDDTDRDGNNVNNKKIFSFEHDDKYIYTSFLSAYNIDLTEKRDLHWWKFKTLLDNLPEDTIMKKVINIRSSKINSKSSREEKKRMMELKKIYQLPMDVEEKSEEFNNALSGMF